MLCPEDPQPVLIFHGWTPRSRLPNASCHPAFHTYFQNLVYNHTFQNTDCHYANDYHLTISHSFYGPTWSVSLGSSSDQRDFCLLYDWRASLNSVRATQSLSTPTGTCESNLIRFKRMHSLYGITILQAYIYFRDSSQNSTILRSFVSEASCVQLPKADVQSSKAAFLLYVPHESTSHKGYDDNYTQRTRHGLYRSHRQWLL